MKALQLAALLLVACSPLSTLSALANSPPVLETTKIAVNVLGHVNRQDRVALTEGATALDALAAAGGAALNANLRRARILRKRGDQTETISVNLKAIMSGKAPDVALRDNDTLVIDPEY